MSNIIKKYSLSKILLLIIFDSVFILTLYYVSLYYVEIDEFSNIYYFSLIFGLVCFFFLSQSSIPLPVIFITFINLWLFGYLFSYIDFRDGSLLYRLQIFLLNYKITNIMIFFSVGLINLFIFRLRLLLVPIIIIAVLIGLVYFYQYESIIKSQQVLIDLGFFIFIIITYFLYNRTFITYKPDQKLHNVHINKTKYYSSLACIVLFLLLIASFVSYPKVKKTSTTRGLDFLFVDDNNQSSNKARLPINTSLNNDNSLNHTDIPEKEMANTNPLFKVEPIKYPTNLKDGKFNYKNYVFYFREFLFEKYDSDLAIFTRDPSRETHTKLEKKNEMLIQPMNNIDYVIKYKEYFQFKYYIHSKLFPAIVHLPEPLSVKINTPSNGIDFYLNINNTITTIPNKPLDDNVSYTITSLYLNPLLVEHYMKLIDSNQYLSYSDVMNPLDYKYFTDVGKETNFTSKMKKLTKKILKSQPQIPFSKKVLIDLYNSINNLKTYLKSNYTYSYTTGNFSKEGLPLENFIFGSKQKGYCVYFAEALCLMCRINGIPSRVVGGYVGSSENYDEKENKYIITRRYSHAWTECLIPGFGWIIFDASPQQRQSNTKDKDEIVNQIIDYNDSYWKSENDNDNSEIDIVRKEYYNDENKIKKLDFYFRPNQNNNKINDKLELYFDNENNPSRIMLLDKDGNIIHKFIQEGQTGGNRN